MMRGDRRTDCPRHDGSRRFIAALAATVLVALAAPAGGRAVIHAANVLDGPGPILEVDGAALAPDGSGAILYRKQVGGVSHVFVVQLLNGRWGAPVEVDSEDPYGASEPAIAAGDGGRLLVVWVQPRNTSTSGITLDELMSASLQPGVTAFGQPIVVDANVSDPNTGYAGAVDPSLAMAPSGRAYVVYRVVTNACLPEDPLSSSCVPGSTDEPVDVRVARFEYLMWSPLGPINRAPQIAMRKPTSENAPAIGISLDGNGVVAWQEPGSDHVARIWVRRLFGSVQGNVLQASPETLSGRPVSGDADAPAVAVGPFGEARIAYRIHGGAGSTPSSTQLYVNSIGSETDPHGSQLEGSAAVPGIAQDSPGPPSDAIEANGHFRLAWTQGGAVRELAGALRETGSPLTIGAGGGSALTTINPSGGGVTAWQSPPGSPPAAEVREDYAQGAFQSAQLAGGVAGSVAGLALGGDGQGDALLAFAQGAPGESELVGDFVQSPPAQFVLDAPVGWLRAHSALLRWETAPDAVTGVTYTVYVDGRPRLQRLTGLTARLGPVGLGDGVHHIQVLATDAAGQQTMSAMAELKIDADPPIVRLAHTRGGRGVRVTVHDSASGVAKRSLAISFGDGFSVHGRARVSHVYRSAGTYTIAAHVRDKVGNAATVHLRVRVT